LLAGVCSFTPKCEAFKANARSFQGIDAGTIQGDRRLETLLHRFMDESTRFLRKHPNNMLLWHSLHDYLDSTHERVETGWSKQCPVWHFPVVIPSVAKALGYPRRGEGCGEPLNDLSDSRIFFKEGSNFIQKTPP
jgi:hypothetical protein